ncbi:MAG: glycosyl hydrolase [Solirubrobacterales bacterium]
MARVDSRGQWRALGAVVLTALGCLLAAPADAGAVRSEFYGIVQGQFQAEGQLDSQDLQGMASARIRTDRFQLGWKQIEPSRGTYRWDATDAFVGALASKGIRAVPFVWGSPSWVASSPGRPPIDTPAHQQAWTEFLQAAVARYGRGGTYWAGPYHQEFGSSATPLPIQAWQIWNEPNLKKFFDPSGSNAQLAQKYGTLLKISHDAITAQDPEAQIVLAGNPGYPPSGGPKAWEFLNSLYDVPGIKNYFDAAALHPYASDIKHVQIEIQNVRDVMDNHGDHATPLWITEIGWGSAPPDRYGINQGPEGQKEKLSGAYRLILGHRNAWNIQRLFWFLWRDPDPSSAFANRCSFCASAGLHKFDRSNKPAFALFKGFTADTKPPNATIPQGPANGTTINNPSPSFSLSSSDLGSTFECHVDAAPFTPCNPRYTTPALPDGGHGVFVRAIDPAGNVSQIKSRHFTVDTVPPTIAITSGPANGSATSNPSASFSFVTDNGALTCQLDAASFASCTSPYAVSGLADGVHTFKVKATDEAGNTRVAASTWTVDTVAPTVSITSGPAQDTTSHDPRPSFGFAASESGTTMECQLDGGGFQACTSPFTGSGRLADGLHTFDVRATDRAGNLGPTTTRSWTVDAQVDVRITSGLASGSVTSKRRPGFQFTSSDSLATFRCRINGPGHPFHACTSTASEPYRPAKPLEDGWHMFSVKALDPPDESEVISRTFKVDTRAPTARITSGPANGSASSDPAPSFAFTADEAGSHFQCRLDAKPFSPCSSPRSIAPLNDGDHVFGVRAIDAAGNRSKPEVVGFTIDTVAPGLKIKGPSEVRTKGSRASAAFDLKASEAVSRQCRVTSKGFQPCPERYRTPKLATGPHVLKVIATDRAGNVTTKQKQFRIVQTTKRGRRHR